MGSASDRTVLEPAALALREFAVPFEFTIVFAHRIPERMVEFAKSASSRGIKVIIAGAGGAAHLPGMVASLTELPVIGVPVKSANSMDGWDSLLSIVQMPGGVPVAAVALDGGKNAAILAVRILALGDESLRKKLGAFMAAQTQSVLDAARKMENES